MEVKELRCTICTSPHLEKVSDYEYRCSNCGAIVNKEKAEKFEEVYKKLIEEGKNVDLHNLRCLVKKSLEGHMNKTLLEEYSREILRILPDDVLSLFYIKYVNRNNNPLEYETFLENIPSQATNTEIDELIDIIIDNCRFREKDYVLNIINTVYKKDYSKLKSLELALNKRREETEAFSDIPRDVFICWSSNDKKEADKVLKALEEDGNRCWISSRNMPWDTDNYWDNITKAIKSCDIFLCISSENSMQSIDCRKEIEIATRLNKNKRIEYKIDNSSDITLFKRFFTGQWITNIDDLLEKVYDSIHKETSLYEDAKDLLEKGDFKKAKETFLDVADYEDALIYIKICDECINAIALYNEGLFSEAKEKLLILKTNNIAINVINKLISKYDEKIIENEISKGEFNLSVGLYDEAGIIYRNLLTNSKDNFKVWYGYLKALTHNFTDNTNPSINNVYVNALKACANDSDKKKLTNKYNDFCAKFSNDDNKESEEDEEKAYEEMYRKKIAKELEESIKKEELEKQKQTEEEKAYEEMYRKKIAKELEKQIRAEYEKKKK